MAECHPIIRALKKVEKELSLPFSKGKGIILCDFYVAEFRRDNSVRLPNKIAYDVFLTSEFPLLKQQAVEAVIAATEAGFYKKKPNGSEIVTRRLKDSVEMGPFRVYVDRMPLAPKVNKGLG